MKLMETKNLTKKYGKYTAVNQLNIEIHSGKLTGFLGTNGAGKSTTIQMLTNTLKQSSGEIHYFNHNQPVTIGVVFQNSVLDNELTVFDNLMLRSKMYRDILKEDVMSLMKKTGIWSYSQKKYGKLSGGMKRKVDITRALLNNPDMLILDEPTTGLDPQSRKEIWLLLHELKENGLGIFLTTHYLDEAESADYIYILEKGTILEEGSVNEIERRYGQPVIMLYSHNVSALKEELKLFQTNNKSKNGIEVILDNKNQVISLLKQVEPLINDFSYQPMNLNDIFLKITGREVEDDSLM